MATCHTPLEFALSKLVSRTDLNDAELVRAIQFAVQECQNAAILEELKKLNTYMAIITDQDI